MRDHQFVVRHRGFKGSAPARINGRKERMVAKQDFRRWVCTNESCKHATLAHCLTNEQLQRLRSDRGTEAFLCFCGKKIVRMQKKGQDRPYLFFCTTGGCTYAHSCSGITQMLSEPPKPQRRFKCPSCEQHTLLPADKNGMPQKVQSPQMAAGV
jgi:hypothetical protein